MILKAYAFLLASLAMLVLFAAVLAILIGGKK